MQMAKKKQFLEVHAEHLATKTTLGGCYVPNQNNSIFYRKEIKIAQDPYLMEKEQEICENLDEVFDKDDAVTDTKSQAIDENLNQNYRMQLDFGVIQQQQQKRYQQNKAIYELMNDNQTLNQRVIQLQAVLSEALQIIIQIQPPQRELINCARIKPSVSKHLRKKSL